LKIVIAGAGEVGYHLIENLCKENLDIFVIDTNAAVLNKLKSQYNINTDHGNIIDSKYIKKSHLKNTDLFLAITNSDETNMIACKSAKEAGAKKTIARIRQVNLDSTKNHFSLESLGIDWVINPVALVADELFKLVLTPNIVDNHEFSNGTVNITGYKMTDHSTMVGHSIKDIEKKAYKLFFNIGIVQRKDMTIIPKKDEVIQLGDVVYFIYQKSDYPNLRRTIGYPTSHSKSKHVFINGGGNMGLQLANRLEKAHQEVKVIEKRLARSYDIAEKLQKSLVLNFDGTDLKQLSAEGIDNADYFISVTDNEQVNITSCLIANEQGVQRTISLIKQPELIPIIDQNTPITLGISPRILTARYLLRYIQDTHIFSYFSIINSQIEILEMHLEESSTCLNIPIKNLEIPENIIISVINRNEEFIIPDGNSELSVGDIILVIAHRLDRPKAIHFFHPDSK